MRWSSLNHQGEFTGPIHQLIILGYSKINKLTVRNTLEYSQ